MIEGDSNMDRSNDPVYVEERDNLTTVEQHIDAAIAAQTATAQSIQQEINDSWVCSDYESVYERKMLIAKQRECFDRADKYATFKPSPYFGRMDFDVAESGEIIKEGVTYFIGKSDIHSVDNKQIVVDWRNPVGTFFYQKAQRHFLINEYKYTLLLRRALDIRNAELCDLETEYDGEDVSLDGDVIDPFLLTVLKDKRRQTRLTDIIRTIQDNQNSIIRRPYGDSFAVQGCAGSGKTMILLHRLSYLMYNNPKLPLSNIKIITPNKYFDAHISDLSRELGLANIDRYSVDEYYYYLAQKYHKTDKSMPSIRSEKSLNEDLLHEVYSLQYADDMAKRYSVYWEEAIKQLLSVGYQALLRQFNQNTPAFSANNVETYTQLIDVLSRIDDQITATQKGIKDAEARLVSNRALSLSEEEKLNVATCELQKSQSEVRSAIDRELQSKQEELKDIQKQNTATAQSIEAAKDTIVLLTQKAADAREEFRNATVFLDNNTYDSYYAIRSNSTLCALIDIAVTEPAQAIVDMRVTVAEIKKQHENLDLSNQDNISYVKTMLESIKANRASYTDYEQFALLPEDDPVHFRLYRTVEKQIERIISLKQQFESVARYNFVLRNRIRRDIDSAINTFREQATDALNTIEQDAQKRLSSYNTQLAGVASKLRQAEDELSKQYGLFSAALRPVVQEYIEQQSTFIYTSEKEIQDNEAKLTDLQARRDELRKRERYLKSLPPIYQDALEYLKNFGFVSLGSLTDKPRELLAPLVTELNRKYEAFKTVERRVSMLRDSIPQLEKEIEQLKSNGISPDSIQCWADCKKIVDSLSFEKIETKVAHTQLLEAYRKHGQNYNQYTYRHKMYLSLLFCTFYFKRPGISDNFLNIDEAQDISVAEYRMLSSILGSRCAYNLYGDVNQAVYSYKGIGFWENDIPDIVHGNVFMLNENYRNTIPVTNYCNQEFEVGMTAIGISGEDVVEKDLQEAVQWIVQMKKNSPEARAAIIYRHGIKSIQNKLRTLLKPLIEFSWSDVDDHRLSVVSVEMAKGLEFEYVVAVTDQMSDNERYVSFTRAMEALVVVPDKFARNAKSNTDDDDGDDPNNTPEVNVPDPKGSGTKGTYTTHQKEAAAEI